MGIFGLMLSFVLQITTNLIDLLRSTSDQENRMISLERCTYFFSVKPEIGYKDLKMQERALRRLVRKDPKGTQKLPQRTSEWPRTGSLELKNLSVRYRPDLPHVLKQITLSIPSGTKLGIVGRTGAGKSTLISTLYRNFDDYEGDIKFDGIELRSVDLKQLRFEITIIPQDPYLFEDSLRNNLDPLNQFSDEDLVEIIKEIDLWEKFDFIDGLESPIEKGGDNLSQGEKQLVCLARALLLRNRLVLMDEATANIDSKTEERIQRLIEERFQESTILMIAHRLNTILNCDK